jgi:ribosomal protein S18 acetylase RimI-like enzyme
LGNEKINDFDIRQYLPQDQNAVIEVWRKCNLTRSWNNPEMDIKRKLKVNPELFLVGVIGNRVVATVMGGYEGHRGWVNYLAVEPAYQKKGLGRQLMSEIENKLKAMGCPKLNLQVRIGNHEALVFYEKIGYKNDDVISMGKRLIKDE